MNGFFLAFERLDWLLLVAVGARAEEAAPGRRDEGTLVGSRFVAWSGLVDSPSVDCLSLVRLALSGEVVLADVSVYLAGDTSALISPTVRVEIVVFCWSTEESSGTFMTATMAPE
jgi:hypothetical protein